MAANESDLTRIPSRKLVEMYHELNKQAVRSAHDQARRKLLESLERGPVREETDASLFDKGCAETDSSLVEQARQVKAEIKRRVQAGDAELDAIAADILESGFPADQPERALVDSLLGVRTQPQAEKESPQTSPARSKWFESSPDILKRRQLVLKNPRFSARQYCKVFDECRIPLPSPWEEELGVSTWVEAYKTKKGRPRIQRIISEDKKCA